MGLTYAEIELTSCGDLEMVHRGQMAQDEVKRITVSMLVDTGCMTLAINENIQEYLQLRVIGSKRAQLANGHVARYNIVGPVFIKFKNRDATCNAFVLPGDSEPLLGAIPMEEMDVIIHPNRNELIAHPDHPDFPVLKMRTLLTPKSDR